MGRHLLSRSRVSGMLFAALSAVSAPAWSLGLGEIELSSALYAAAVRRFRRARNVTLLHGDSAVVLPDVLRDLHEPAVFWLDAHFASGETAQGPEVTPVWQELEHVLAHPVEGHVVLADDARAFTSGLANYPSLEDVRKRLGEAGTGWALRVEHDIIRIHRRR